VTTEAVYLFCGSCRSSSKGVGIEAILDGSCCAIARRRQLEQPGAGLEPGYEVPIGPPRAYYPDLTTR